MFLAVGIYSSTFLLFVCTKCANILSHTNIIFQRRMCGKGMKERTGIEGYSGFIRIYEHENVRADSVIWNS